MPAINIMTWNSDGESAAKAAFLQDLILNNPSVPGWQPDVVVIQEAQAAPGGDIWNMLSNLGGQPGGGNYTVNAPQFAPLSSEGYIFMTSNHVTLAGGAFTVVDLATDPGVLAAIDAFATPLARATAIAEVELMRDPARAPIAFAGRALDVMTWHAPLGPSRLIQGISAAVNYDAYYFFQSSNYYTATLLQPGAGNLSAVAGDLNVTASDLTNPTEAPVVPYLFPGWTGVSSNLDHILAYRNVGSVASITFPNAGSYQTGLSDHAVEVSSVSWP